MLKFTPLLLLLFLFNNSVASAQNLVGQKPEKDVPVTVSSAFSSKFPGTDVVWFSSYQGRYDQKQVYEGRFIFDKRYSSAIYDKTGNLVAFVATVEMREVPAAAREYMDEKYPSFPILDAILVTRQKDVVTYELGIMIDGEYVIKVFSDKGDFIKSTRG